MEQYVQSLQDIDPSWPLKNQRMLYTYAIFENSINQQDPSLSQVIVRPATTEVLTPKLSCKT